MKNMMKSKMIMHNCDTYTYKCVCKKKSKI